MAYQSEIPCNYYELEAWQRAVCLPLASSCIAGFACAEQVIALFMHPASFAGSFRSAETPAPEDADSFALAMDCAMGATDISLPAPSLEVWSVAVMAPAPSYKAMSMAA